MVLALQSVLQPRGHARILHNMRGAASVDHRISEISEVQINGDVSRLRLKYFGVVVLCQVDWLA